MQKPKSRQTNTAKSRRKENSGEDMMTEWTPATANLVTRNITRHSSHLVAAKKEMRVRGQSRVEIRTMREGNN